MAIRLFSLFIVGFLASCSSGPCNNVPQRPQGPETSTSGPNPASNDTALAAPADAITVSKPTGEKQCGMGKGISLDEMADTLKKQGIEVYESHTQSDGMMHTALCGSPTGNIHVFTISKKDLKKALKLGFKSDVR